MQFSKFKYFIKYFLNFQIFHFFNVTAECRLISYFIFEQSEMKRKREISEDEGSDEYTKTDKTDSKPKSAKKKSKLKQLIIINLSLFTILVIPLLAIIGKIDHKNVLVTMDKIYGERCYSDYWKPKNLTKLKISLDENLFGQHIAKSVITSALTR